MKTNLKKNKASSPPKYRDRMRINSSWSSFESEIVKKRKIVKKFEIKSSVQNEKHFKKQVNGKNKHAHSDKNSSLYKTKNKKVKRLNVINKKNDNFISRNITIGNFLKFNIEYLSFGMTFYLIYKNIVELSLKHLVYLLTGTLFNKMVLFVLIYGLVHTLLLFICMYGLKRTKNTELLYCICYSIQILMFIIFGIVQLNNDMTIWDKIMLLNEHFTTEFVKYFFELLFLLICCLFKYLKLFNAIKM